jgi:uncharacterized membrane protein YraQ (UPF0718 family)
MKKSCLAGSLFLTTMDPEIFFLSVGMIGWKLAIWRLVATLFLSVAAGFITHMLIQNGRLGREILRMRKVTKVKSTREFFKNGSEFKV